MLFVGEMDENVDPASTMQVVNALIKADADIPVCPNQTSCSRHGRQSRPYVLSRQRLPKS
jgi:beta-lactamase class D